MKKLMFYINSIRHGGAERVIVQLAGYFAENGYKSILVTSFADKDEYSVSAAVVRYSLEDKESQQSKLMRNLKRITALRKIIVNEKPDAVISFMAEPNFRSIIATIGLPVKCVVSVRNDPNREYAGRILHFVGKHILPRADGCVFQTEDAKRWFPEKLQKKSQVIFNAVDPVFFNSPRVGGEHFVAVGRLVEQKNYGLMIRAFANAVSSHPELKLDIYGDGDLRDKIMEDIDLLHMEKNIALCGITSNVAEKLSTAAGYILSSDYEGMPNALMEALTMGVPCISTDCPCGGPRMLIQDDVNGILVPVGDVDQMSQAIIRLADNKHYAEILGVAAQNAAAQFKPDQVLKCWEKYLDKVING